MISDGRVDLMMHNIFVLFFWATAVCNVCVTISIFAKRVTQKGKIKIAKP